MPYITDSASSGPAASWRPQSEVEFIVGTPPGGGQDRPARALMRVIGSSGLINVPMQLTNLPGKGGGHAWDALRRRAGDPHVLAISSAPLLTNRLLGVSDFDHSELTPVATLYTEYLAFVARADSPLRTGADLLERMRADAGALTFSLATAIGTTNHIALGQIVRHLGGDPKSLKLRVFDSALKAVADVLEGHADAGAVSAVSAAKALESGGLRGLAVSAPERLGGLFGPVPTWSEQSVPCVIGQWRGFIGAPGMAADAIAYWEQALAAAAASSAWAAELEQNFWTATYMASGKTRAFLDSERAFVGRMLAELGLIPPAQ